MIKSPKHWQQTGQKINAVALLLYPFSLVYSVAGTLSRMATIPWKSDIPVICVGNIVAGGAGKTPVAIDIATRLKNMGKNPNMVTRGYGGDAGGPLMVAAGSNWHDTGDEAILLSAAAATWVAKDRKAGVIAAANNKADAVVLDDGFQNPSVMKDLSIVVVDGGFGFGNKMLLPAGPLRESINAGISRASAVVIIGEDKLNSKNIVKQVNPTIEVLQAQLQPLNGDELKNRDVIAFAGIGRPEKFFETLVELGCNIKSRHPFPDHYEYSVRDISPILEMAEKTNAAVVTTEKDAVKIPANMLEKIIVLKVGIKWSDQDDVMLERLLLGVLDNG